ncbi:MAG: cell division protein ZapA [Desulfuromonadales bacterium]|nr:MAG: cell division protein ZapA [Desulfuromonadales bacterium]
MTAVKAPHRIRVLGKEITVKSTASPQHVQEVESLVNRKLTEAQALVTGGDPQVHVIIALMNLAETCITLTQDLAVQERGHKETVERLVRRIENILR